MTALYDVDAYPEGHSPFCFKDCAHPCHDAYDERCAVCDGEGEVACGFGETPFDFDTEPCPACDGTGKSTQGDSK